MIDATQYLPRANSSITSQTASLIVTLAALVSPLNLSAADLDEVAPTGGAQLHDSIATWGANYNLMSGLGGTGQGITIWNIDRQKRQWNFDLYRGLGKINHADSYDIGNREYLRMETTMIRLNTRLFPKEDSTFNVVLGAAYAEVSGRYGYDGSNPLSTDVSGSNFLLVAAIGNRLDLPAFGSDSRTVHLGVDWFGLMPSLRSNTKVDIASSQGRILHEAAQVSGGSGERANELMNKGMQVYFLNAYIGTSF